MNRMRAIRGSATTNRKIIVLVVAGFAVLGTIIMLNTSAASRSLSLETESGSATGSTTVVSDVAASGGKAVRFSQAVAGDKLRWAPPTSSAWRDLRVGGNTSPKEYVLASGVDYNMPSKRKASVHGRPAHKDDRRRSEYRHAIFQ